MREKATKKVFCAKYSQNINTNLIRDNKLCVKLCFKCIFHINVKSELNLIILFLDMFGNYEKLIKFKYQIKYNITT